MWRVHNFLHGVQLLPPVIAEVQPHVVMELDSRDLVTRAILLHGVWEPGIVQLVTEALQSGSVFIDIGAHVGYHSLLASARVGSNGRVISVEPNPVTARQLRRNVWLSGAENVTVREVACTDTAKSLPFYQARAHNTGASSMSERNAKSAANVAVEGLPLDAIVKSLDLGRIDLVKIDAEGAELRILLGMRESLARYRPKLILELKPELLANLDANIEEVLVFLHRQGYVQDRHIGADDYLWVPAL